MESLHILGSEIPDVIEVKANLPAVISGFGGKDRLRGSNADCTIYGGLGDDVIDGGTGSDRILGGAGVDIIKDAGGRFNSINGGDLRGGPDADYLFGGDGRDKLIPGTGETELRALGGAGPDLFLIAVQQANPLQMVNDYQPAVGDQLLVVQFNVILPAMSGATLHQSTASPAAAQTTSSPSMQQATVLH